MKTETKILIDELTKTQVAFAKRKLLSDVMVATRGYITKDGIPRPLVSVHLGAGTFKITLGNV